MRFFLAGIMQGSKVEAVLHHQDYRDHLRALLKQYFPDDQVYDPLAEHRDSINYDAATGRAVFMRHNAMCREVDAVIAFVPQASMGTAIEMWEAFSHGRMVITISPLVHNWVVRFCSHVVYPDMASFEQALQTGQLQEKIRAWNN